MSRSFGMLAMFATLTALLPAGCEGQKPAGAGPAGTPGAPPAGTGQASAAAPAGGGRRISGPYTHANLSVFLIHGEDTLKNKKIITLKEALDARKAVVHETGNVQELSIENLSDQEVLFVQSGDIVKGGKQDRVIAYDLLVPPRSGKMPINSFCVEQGRWRRRGGENADLFSSAEKQVAGKDLKLAAKLNANQSEVWSEVRSNQSKLSGNLGGPVNDSRSASSMQLTLENEKVQASVREYVAKLAAAPRGRTDVIGFAFAVNGKVNSADVYASAELFRKLWDKLLEAAAVEAVAELKKGASFAEPKADDVRKCMDEARASAARPKAVSPRVEMITRESPASYGFETVDKKDGQVVHENYMAK